MKFERIFDLFFRGDRVLIPILILALFLRLWGLGSALYFDEFFWMYSVKGMLNDSLPLLHPPLAFLFYYIFFLIGGFSVQVFRAMPLFIGLLTIIVSYYFAKSLYGRRIAILSALLMSVIFYPVWMSLFMDVDGNLLTLFSIATLFSFHKFENKKEGKWIFFTGVFLGLALLSKYPAIILVPVLLLYDWLSSRLGNLKPVLISVFIGFAILSIFPISSFLLNSTDTLISSLQHSSEYIGRTDTENIFNAYALSIGKLIVFLFQYGTPILFLLPLYLIGKFERKDYILLSYTGVIIFFYTFVVAGGPKVRYIMPIVPILIILSSKSIITFIKKFDRRDITIFACLFVLSISLISIFNTYGAQEAFDSKNMRLDLLLGNSMFWYSGFASTPFAIHIHSLIFVILVSVILFLFSFKFGNKFIIAIISLGLAFNFFILAQSFNPTIGPNYTDTVSQMVGYKETHDMECEIYLTEKSLWYYFEDALQLYGIGNDLFSRVNMTDEVKSIKFEDIKGCVFTIKIKDWERYEWLKNVVNKCEKIMVFRSNGFDSGYIYRCL